MGLPLKRPKAFSAPRRFSCQIINRYSLQDDSRSIEGKGLPAGTSRPAKSAARPAALYRFSFSTSGASQKFCFARQSIDYEAIYINSRLSPGYFIFRTPACAVGGRTTNNSAAIIFIITSPPDICLLLWYKSTLLFVFQQQTREAALQSARITGSTGRPCARRCKKTKRTFPPGHAGPYPSFPYTLQKRKTA